MTGSAGRARARAAAARLACRAEGQARVPACYQPSAGRSLSRARGEAIVSDRQRDASRTRLKIICAAEQVFSTKSYTEATVREITQLAGVSLALARRYYGSKIGLYTAVLDQAMGTSLIVGQEKQNFGQALVASFFDPPEAHVHSLPILIGGASDPEARAVALRLLHRRIVEPLATWLGGEAAAEKAVQIMLITSGFFLFRSTLPLQPLQGEASLHLRRWLERVLQGVVDER
jgi:AcrR family transcriptional regulator